MPRVHIIERAFQLARGGTCVNTSAIARRLSEEGYLMIGQHLDGLSIRTELNKACRAAQATEKIG